MPILPGAAGFFMPTATPTTILGIDPGTQVMGYGLLRMRGATVEETLAFGVLNLTRYDDHAEKLHRIFQRIVEILDGFKPDAVAIEAPFFGKNVQSMLKLGRAQGVAIAAAMHRGIPVTEYSPRKVKQSVTGNGNASKEQVMAMVERLLGVNLKAEQFDATDGLAVALCHGYQHGPGRMPVTKTKGWDAFLKQNPERLASPSLKKEKK